MSRTALTNLFGTAVSLFYPLIAYGKTSLIALLIRTVTSLWANYTKENKTCLKGVFQEIEKIIVTPANYNKTFEVFFKARYFFQFFRRILVHLKNSQTIENSTLVTKHTCQFNKQNSKNRKQDCFLRTKEIMKAN